MSLILDRFAPEGPEDFAARGRTAQQVARMSAPRAEVFLDPRTAREQEAKRAPLYAELRAWSESTLGRTVCQRAEIAARNLLP